MGTRTKELIGRLALLFVLAVALDACSAEDGGDSAPATTQAAETSDTEAPESDPPTTNPEATDPPASDEPEPEAPTTTAASEEPQAGETSGSDAEGDEPELEPADVPVWVWILAGFVLLVAVIWMVTRAGSTEGTEETTQPEPPADS